MADLQQLEEFVSQNVKPERTIKCFPDGISFEQFATICDLPGAPDATKKALQTPVLLQLRNAPLKEDEKVANIVITLQLLVDQLDSFVTLQQYAWLTSLRKA
uniref:Uncharacterized protein n=1 Tax=Anopheles maculatus TaxID=74869 RepID=A0A182SCT6_9DIPT